MTAHPPPVPPDQRSPKGGAGPASDRSPQPLQDADPQTDARGRAQNTKQNTTNKGLQQDR